MSEVEGVESERRWALTVRSDGFFVRNSAPL